MMVTAECNEVFHCMGSPFGERNEVVNFEESGLTTEWGWNAK
jgi:5-keto 4-deoxyuronate isomerase